MNAWPSAVALYLVHFEIGHCVDVRQPSQHPSNNQPERMLMSKEFEKLEALLYLSEPGEREPHVDRGEAAKLAARWGWLVHRGRKQRVELPRVRQLDRGASGTA